MLLNEIHENTVVEMAFSFDNGYSIEDVNELFKEQLAWYWVHTYSELDIERKNQYNVDENFPYDPVYGSEAFGFPSNRAAEDYPPTNFISILEQLKDDGGDYKAEAGKIISNITNDGKLALEPANLKIIGVIVTGKPSELQKFNNVSIIRGATLGATTDLY